ncbi:bifunctional dethiobiotin synthetase/7,8-diamino-pelargonic acid aminotransferase, mitochondrial [Mercurialis annua]|uniref:bifunctional dethiobiotin synthetase/7,8-diamino-pelargonic acid aminotransferase, mitochondrial n=1 Tax=Mercurialis annua TaxID=3986 RepID=UPI00215F0488|nr:bifunctional dethiobiotin synthetase/7,8-diamino-pelargonic acid aminotransferase, mitochondrial [Mercurialis annua]XP_055960519.1 bifunctional dethiobiotin synthetase/7,8-diamino-pelargonic acid aminotransferase, mitochondrial [Mercurialis annua]XP_055960520.1 bifunctional dethiobiotin synthetase/7,8-diamino-pelargonic acid aminotransferase, mitochondrial [Mercurialis annua]
MLFHLLRHRHHQHCFRRLISTTTSPSPPLSFPLSHPAYIIWGSNTSLGKTLISTGLASSFLLSSATATSPPRKFLYLKPVQTGFPTDSDSNFLFTKLSSLASSLPNHNAHSLYSSNSVLKASHPASKSVNASQIESKCGMYELNFHEEKKTVFTNVYSELICKTLFAWNDAVSPHLAAERENTVVEDSDVLECLKNELELFSKIKNGYLNSFCIIETAGGVASPGPSGSLQCDLYRPFRFPGVLVGDGRLGGISGTISAYESLKLRGYDIAAVVFEDHGLTNEVPLLSYLRNRVPVILLPPVPKDMSNDLVEWFAESEKIFNSLKEVMLSDFSKRVQRLNEMPKKARDVLWWPFTQHRLIPEDSITVIDSRCGENFAVYKAQDNEFITEQFDGCASWWTQGPNATLQTELARDMGYAAGRFGHVMFPENVYEPALECAELLLEGVGKGWASRTYFSDNGSTAIEIALKMAFRKFSSDNGFVLDYDSNNTAERSIELKVLALKGSYHGDTLGAMEAQAPSPYTGFLQQPWYSGRGLFLDPPTVFMSNSIWNLSFPDGMHSESVTNKIMAFRSRDEIFDKSRDHSDLYGYYSSYISQQLYQYTGSEGNIHIGALLIEPVIQGAGGMLMIDPLFQRALVNECRRRNIPIIFDEVFTGFWRLGVESAIELLGCLPDIACFAKLMTGGIIPLATTLASEEVFNSFIGDSKLKALLHGHSYSAHAMGCTAAAKSIKWFKDPSTNFNIIAERRLLRELWNEELIQQISSHPSVQKVVVLGTLFALELRAEGSDAGYASQYSRSLILKLREDGIYMRPLGNVIYLMCGPCTAPETCSQLLIKLQRRLEEFEQIKEEPASHY